MSESRNSQGVSSNTRSVPTRGVWGMPPPMKIFDFIPSEMVSDAFSEYTPRNMQTTHLAHWAFTLASLA